MVADFEELEFWTRQNSMLGDSMRRRSSCRKMVKTQHIPNRRWNSQRVWRRSGFPKIQPERGEELRDDPRGESDWSQPIDTVTDDREARNDFWSSEGNYIFRHHVERKCWSSMCAEEESFPIPLRYIDVRTRTQTTLDVLQENRIDDHWDVVCGREPSEPWTGVTQFTIRNEKFKNIQTDARGPGSGFQQFKQPQRPDDLWPEIWSGMSHGAQGKENQQWTIELP